MNRWRFEKRVREKLLAVSVNAMPSIRRYSMAVLEPSLQAH